MSSRQHIHNKQHLLLLFCSLLVMLLSDSCKFIFGEKDDATIDEIFKQGAIDPNLIPQNVGYVPVLPFFSGLVNPVDVCIGYDELLYVVDDMGLRVMDQKGTLFQTIPIPGATDVTQDRRLHTYIAGRINVLRGGNNYNLAAVYHLVKTGSFSYSIVDTLIHPDCDDSRQSTSFRGADDEAVKFTGLATLYDNTLYVARTGPKNDLTAFARPDNAVLIFDAAGVNTSYANGVNPVSSGLRSVVGLSSIATLAGPPQKIIGMNEDRGFAAALNDQTANLEFRVLYMKYVEDPDVGATFTETQELLDFDTSKARRFLYQSFRFISPEDIYIASDQLQYGFVVDSGTDSLYQFSGKGYEGVNAPATYKDRRQIIASFGGYGSGPFQFKDPSGVCYFRKTIYVADKGNGRICRYRLSTDIE